MAGTENLITLIPPCLQPSPINTRYTNGHCIHLHITHCLTGHRHRGRIEPITSHQGSKQLITGPIVHPRWVGSLLLAPVLNLWYAKCRFSRLHGVKKHGVAGILTSSQALMKVAGHARMLKFERCVVQNVWCFLFQYFPMLWWLRILSNNGKLLHTCNWLKQLPWRLHVKTAKLFLFLICQLNVDAR